MSPSVELAPDLRSVSGVQLVLSTSLISYANPSAQCLSAVLEAASESKPQLSSRQPDCYAEIGSDRDFDVSCRSQTL